MASRSRRAPVAPERSHSRLPWSRSRLTVLHGSRPRTTKPQVDQISTTDMTDWAVTSRLPNEFIELVLRAPGISTRARSSGLVDGGRGKRIRDLLAHKAKILGEGLRALARSSFSLLSTPGGVLHPVPRARGASRHRYTLRRNQSWLPESLVDRRCTEFRVPLEKMTSPLRECLYALIVLLICDCTTSQLLSPSGYQVCKRTDR